MKRLIAAILCLMLLTPSASLAEGFQPCHKTVLQETKTTQRNGSEVHLWQIDTVQERVDAVLNGIARAWAEEIAPSLPAPGGSNSRVLNQWTADATHLPVYAGPGEGTALGNIMAQFIARGEVASLADARKMIPDSFDVKTYLHQPM